MLIQKTTISTLRDNLAARRTARREQLRLEKELAQYTTPADRSELYAIIARHSADETRDLDAILSRQAA